MKLTSILSTTASRQTCLRNDRSIIVVNRCIAHFNAPISIRQEPFKSNAPQWGESLDYGLSLGVKYVIHVHHHTALKTQMANRRLHQHSHLQYAIYCMRLRICNARFPRYDRSLSKWRHRNRVNYGVSFADLDHRHLSGAHLSHFCNQSNLSMIRLQVVRYQRRRA